MRPLAAVGAFRDERAKTLDVGNGLEDPVRVVIDERDAVQRFQEAGI